MARSDPVAGPNDIKPEGGLLLGTAGWQGGAWLADYYPADLPAEWRLAYYANDCDCVLLRASDWGQMRLEELDQSLQEADRRLLYCLEAPQRWTPVHEQLLFRFVSQAAILLVDSADPAHTQIAQWVAQGNGVWVDSRSGDALVCWALERWDMRDLRTRVEHLSDAARVLVVDGRAADPARVRELRTLLALMDRS